MTKDADFEKIIAAAKTAGMAALNAAKPTPMVVGQAAGLFSNKIVPGTEEFVEGGVCGFAWVHFAGNTAFGRWAKKAKIADDDYPKGLMIWVSEGGQSMQRKEAYARAFAKVLQDNGIEAYPRSRMD